MIGAAAHAPDRTLPARARKRRVRVESGSCQTRSNSALILSPTLAVELGTVLGSSADEVIE